MEPDDDFLADLRAAALRARASGFLGTADAIEAIVEAELARRASDGLPGERNARAPSEGDGKKR